MSTLPNIIKVLLEAENRETLVNSKVSISINENILEMSCLGKIWNIHLNRTLQESEEDRYSHKKMMINIGITLNLFASIVSAILENGKWTPGIEEFFTSAIKKDVDTARETIDVLVTIIRAQRLMTKENDNENSN